MKKVLLGLSGGVDSALAAILLKKQGYQVIAAFMKNFSGIKSKLTGDCNWIQDLAAARQVAAFLEIPLLVLDFEKQYRTNVIEPMFNAYKRGITPNPDITCNTIIKFPLLWKEAQKYNCEYVATGHYARVRKTKKGYQLLRGVDQKKDQSYFLYEATQEDLAHLLLPIGTYTKKQVRTLAKKYKLPNFNRPSTKGICFVGNVPMKSFLEQKLKPKSGKVVNEQGKIIGKHRGAHYYTIGERARPSTGIDITKGFESQSRFFVLKKDMKHNTLVVAPDKSPNFYQKIITINKMHWLSKPKPKTRVIVRIRHLGELMPAVLEKKINHWQIILKKPMRRAAPGQAAVIYRGANTLGGGTIA